MAPCESVKDICGVLEQDFFTKIKEARGSEKWITLREKYLKPAVGVILKFSDIVGDVVGSIPTVSGGKVIFTAISFLLQATKGVSEWFDGLNDFFDDLNHFLNQMWEVLPFSAEMGMAYQNVVSETFVCTIEVILEAMGKIGKRGVRFRLFLGELIGSSNEITKAQAHLNKLTSQARDITIAVTARKTMESGKTVTENQKILQSTDTKIDSIDEKIDNYFAKSSLV
ncbi:hypothetical protein GYMLUDRAFT_33863, partial [Collybiopsis luxurians FD-317 M1]